MSDIKLFRIANNVTTEIPGSAYDLEKALQTLIEANLESLLGIHFLATEYSTGKTHEGRIDTLGLDEDHCPVIIEYKRSSNENVINQGLYYLDWLMDHQAEFKLLVLEKFGKTKADGIDWTSPRLLCIAADFTKYDSHAVQQMNRNIELIRYRRFGQDLLLFEQVNTEAPGKARSPNAPSVPKQQRSRRDHAANPPKPIGKDKRVAAWFADMSPAMRDLFDSLENYIQTLGDDVGRKDLQLYVAFKRLRNFATVCFQKNNLLLFLRLNADKHPNQPGFLRDVRNIGHWGTGDIEVTLKTPADLDKAKPLILEAYEG